MTDAEWLMIAPNAMMILARALAMGVAPPLDGRPRRLTGIPYRRFHAHPLGSGHGEQADLVGVRTH